MEKNEESVLQSLVRWNEGLEIKLKGKVTDDLQNTGDGVWWYKPKERTKENGA